MILATIFFASAGNSIRNSCSFSAIDDSTIPFTSEDTSLSLVCDENLGSGTFTDSTAVSPSRALKARIRFSRRSPTFISSHRLRSQPVTARAISNNWLGL